ncbi:unnamed protein product [Psylliodes chrysocephalus]|uniref:Tesmin/TSO1-like CXC domain-containing protein n=1 Tax=Psylliodes chrysocephalus TaxID=3402493 RepID=A0A9P0G936_9CUCU|nr:unnamed protein product [Psylliodes chrysocephala]
MLEKGLSDIEYLDNDDDSDYEETLVTNLVQCEEDENNIEEEEQIAWYGSQGQDETFDPLEWAWELVDGELSPLTMTQEADPEEILNKISCSCETNCGTRCGCHRSGLECSLAYKHCDGNCSNQKGTSSDEEEDEEGEGDEEGKEEEEEFEQDV